MQSFKKLENLEIFNAKNLIHIENDFININGLDNFDECLKRID